MTPSRQDLLDLIKETYGTSHPDFASIRKQYNRIIKESNDENVISDTRLLIAGLDIIQNTYEDWRVLSNHEKSKSLDVVERIRNLTRSTLRKYDVSVD